MTKIELLKKKCADFEKELKELFNADNVFFDIAIDEIGKKNLELLKKQGIYFKEKHTILNCYYEIADIDLDNGVFHITSQLKKK